MNITLLGAIFGAILLALPIFIIFRYNLNIMRHFLTSLLRLVVSVALLALIMMLSVLVKSIVIDVLLAIVLCLITSLLTTGKARLKMQKMYLPVAAGVLAGTLAVGLYFVYLVMGFRNPFLSNAFMPVIGLLAGGMISVNAKALIVYNDGLAHHGQLYNYLLGNGCSPRQALDYFVRRSLRASILSVSKQMSRIVLVEAPVAFLVAILGGCDIVTAVALQVLLLIAVASASTVSVLVTLTIERKRSSGNYI